MRYISYIISLLLILLTTGCTDDTLIPEPGGEISPDTPFTLTFTVGVPSMDTGSTPDKSRAIYYGNPVYYEDWIDTQDGLKVLFFITKREKTGDKYVQGKYADDDPRVASDPINPLKDYFLFESKSRWATQLPYDDDGNLRYRITVPVYQIGEQDADYKDHWERIRKLLREYDFKVAILANHPADKNVEWGIGNSILNAPDIDNLAGIDELKTINHIHHSVGDTSYNSDNAFRKDAYLMLVDNKHPVDGLGAMGPYIDWVTARSVLYGDALGGTFTTADEARVWIRDYWVPDLIYNEDTDPDIDYKTLYHNYRNIWSYWNFGGEAPDNGLPYTDKSRINTHLHDWEVRNGAMLRKWILDGVANEGILTNLSTAPVGEDKHDGSLPLTFFPSASKAVINDGSNGKRFYGVRLPGLSAAPSAVTDKDCFHMTFNATGSVTVRYVSHGGTLYVKRGGTQVSADSKLSFTKKINGKDLKESVFQITTIDNPVDGYVYALKGDVTIYDIEFTQDEYVYNTDREGILPSSDHPIPMYGVQKYSRLEGFWDEGASFDLTLGGRDEAGNEYDTRTIMLLRAVAKVELLIPKSLGVPRHVYIHGLNRHVRCEPMDVATPTNEIWKDHDNGCEWKAIQARGTMYGSDAKYDMNDYKKKLAWFYGNWLEWGWDFNGFTQYIADYDKEGPFPRVFNPFINRANAAAFIDVTDYYNDQFYHYLFYMGEMLLDAPSNYNGNGGGIIVPTIRIRFDERYASTSKVAINTDLNLNDNDCYRIYFTDGGIAPGARNADGSSKIASGAYASQYDNKPAYIRTHWPIMRNHIYRFEVLDVTSDKMSGLVVNAQDRSTDFNFN